MKGLGNHALKLSRRGLLSAGVAVGVAWTMALPSYAQDFGDPNADIIDHPEEMRLWIQNIGTYARSLKRDFAIVVEDGLSLMSKPDPQDTTQLFPAQAYIRSIDGVLQHDLIKFIEPEPPTDENFKEDPEITLARARTIEDTEVATIMGVGVMNVEYATNAQKIDTFYNASQARRFTPFVAKGPLLGRIPTHPRYAFNANPTSLDRINQAKNFIYVAHSQGFGTADDYVQALAGTNYDVVVTSVFHGRQPLTKRQVEGLKYKKLGARRLVLAEMDIAHAATYHYYWQPEWLTNPPDFVGPNLRTDPDMYHAMFWDPGWQAVISGNTDSYLYGIMALGFDGVVLTGTKAWEFYAGGADEE
ncbi:hypothetical protein V5T82_04055 [Magnetovibrio sp. PR-2]|uniref:hypothetical protein n=1 Tax=Magnetovibrio sp. PR-2 TaxID=3120356 RepID=UPI002FCE0640